MSSLCSACADPMFSHELPVFSLCTLRVQPWAPCVQPWAPYTQPWAPCAQRVQTLCSTMSSLYSVMSCLHSHEHQNVEATQKPLMGSVVNLSSWGHNHLCITELEDVTIEISKTRAKRQKVWEHRADGLTIAGQLQSTTYVRQEHQEKGTKGEQKWHLNKTTKKLPQSDVRHQTTNPVIEKHLRQETEVFKVGEKTPPTQTSVLYEIISLSQANWHRSVIVPATWNSDSWRRQVKDVPGLPGKFKYRQVLEACIMVVCMYL